VMVAEQRRLPPAKAVERHRHRDRDVDADHAYLDAMRELPRRIAVTGVDGRLREKGAAATFDP
jgi:hypothetical protein